MKRIFVLLISVAVLLSGLTACAPNRSETVASDISSKTHIADFSDSKVGSVAGSVQSKNTQTPSARCSTLGF